MYKLPNQIWFKIVNSSKAGHNKEGTLHVSYVKIECFNYFLFLGNKSVWSQV